MRAEKCTFQNYMSFEESRFPEGSCSNQKSPSELEQENRKNFNLMLHAEPMKIDPCQSDLLDEKIKKDSLHALSSRVTLSEICSGYPGALDPNEVMTTALTASSASGCYGGRIVLLHKDVILRLCCMKLKVLCHLSSEYQDHAGRPRLSIVVDAPPSLCHVLDVCDELAQKVLVGSGSSSKWEPVVRRKGGFSSSSTIRLRIPTIANGEGAATYATEIYEKDACGSIRRRAFSGIDVAVLDSLFVPGTHIDACFKLDSYDYQQKAGIRLVAEFLIVQSN